MENLMISANAVLPMCLVMALGYGTRRLGWLRREEISTINKIAFRRREHHLLRCRGS